MLGPGERAATGPGETHSLWNEGPEAAHVITGHDPPLAIEPFFTAIPQALASKNPFKIACACTQSHAKSQTKVGALRVFIAVFGSPAVSEF